MYEQFRELRLLWTRTILLLINCDDGQYASTHWSYYECSFTRALQSHTDQKNTTTSRSPSTYSNYGREHRDLWNQGSDAST
eukprot:2944097-Amphidinium_carterae.1